MAIQGGTIFLIALSVFSTFALTLAVLEMYRMFNPEARRRRIEMRQLALVRVAEKKRRENAAPPVLHDVWTAVAAAAPPPQYTHMWSNSHMSTLKPLGAAPRNHNMKDHLDVSFLISMPSQIDTSSSSTEDFDERCPIELGTTEVHAPFALDDP